jgi:uncharacterized lipoprotein NlpE involved in copper resistance
MFTAKKKVITLVMLLPLILAGCSSSSDQSSDDPFTDFSDIFSESANVSSVKDAYLGSCPTATLGEMADAFMSGVSWTDFPSSGGTIVELTGEISYDGYPSTAQIQFELSGGSFEAVYLGINDVDQNRLTLSALLGKMCDATY